MLVLATLVVLAVAVTVGGFFASQHPLIEALTNGRLQLLLIAMVLVIVAALLGQRSLVAVAMVVVTINALFVIPYLTPASGDARPANDQDVIRVMQYNIWFGNKDMDGIAQHVRDADADVVVLHELTTAQWIELELRLVDEYRFTLGVPLDAKDGQLGGGMAVLTRSAQSRRLPVPAEFSPADRVLLAVATETPGGEELLVVGLHPHASRHDRRKVDLRQQQLAGVVQLAADWDGPAVVVTDMNVTPTSPIYTQLLHDLGWRDPHRTVGWKSTWPTWGGWFGLPIDHVLVSDRVALHSYMVGDGAGSDHKSVTAEVSVR